MLLDPGKRKGNHSDLAAARRMMPGRHKLRITARQSRSSALLNDSSMLFSLARPCLFGDGCNDLSTFVGKLPVVAPIGTLTNTANPSTLLHFQKFNHPKPSAAASALIVLGEI
jgi:hypothetical protein